jgi:hypothetical protein
VIDSPYGSPAGRWAPHCGTPQANASLSAWHQRLDDPLLPSRNACSLGAKNRIALARERLAWPKSGTAGSEREKPRAMMISGGTTQPAIALSICACQCHERRRLALATCALIGEGLTRRLVVCRGRRRARGDRQLWGTDVAVLPPLTASLRRIILYGSTSAHTDIRVQGTEGKSYH